MIYPARIVSPHPWFANLVYPSASLPLTPFQEALPHSNLCGRILVIGRYMKDEWSPRKQGDLQEFPLKSIEQEIQTKMNENVYEHEAIALSDI